MYLQRVAKRMRFPKWKNALLSSLIPNSKLNPSIIILGNQKAGTTAIAALLARALGCSVTLDFPDMHGPLNELYANEITFLQFVRGYRFCFSRNIVKEPNLTFLYPELRERFPKAQFVFVIRDPRDNIRSMLNRMGLLGNVPAMRETDIVLRNKVWQAILNGTWLPNSEAVNYVETLAYRWNWATAVYEQAADSILLAKYEDFVAEKSAFIYDLVSRLGKTPTHDISKLVDIQYQPSGDRDISWRSFYGRHNLDRIENICGAKMVHYGYQKASHKLSLPINGHEE